MNDSSVSALPLNLNPELPSSLETLFWDCDFSSLNWQKNRNFIIRRILDRGDWSAVTSFFEYPYSDVGAPGKWLPFGLVSTLASVRIV